MNKLTRLVAIHTLVIAGAKHLKNHSDLTGLEIGLTDMAEALGRVFGSRVPDHDPGLLLGQVREYTERLFAADEY